MARRIATSLLTTAEAAEELGVSPRTMEGWRIDGEGPPYVRIHARCVRYRAADLEEWISSRVHKHTTAEAAAQ